MNFGYVRVSAKDQHLDIQPDLLLAAGVDRVFQEKISGITTEQPELIALLRGLRAGDTVFQPAHQHELEEHDRVERGLACVAVERSGLGSS